MTPVEFWDHASPFVIFILGAANVWIFGLIKTGREAREKLTEDLGNFKLTVAKEYVTVAGLREIEDRMVAAIERLGDRLDRIFERTDQRNHP